MAYGAGRHVIFLTDGRSFALVSPLIVETKGTYLLTSWLR